MHTRVQDTDEIGTLPHFSYLLLFTEFVQLQLQMLYDATEMNYAFHTDMIANRGYSKIPPKRLRNL